VPTSQARSLPEARRDQKAVRIPNRNARDVEHKHFADRVDLQLWAVPQEDVETDCAFYFGYSADEKLAAILTDSLQSSRCDLHEPGSKIVPASGKIQAHDQ